MSVLNDASKSAHELRANLRKANIRIGILEKQLASAQACLLGSHTFIKGSCISCGLAQKANIG